MASLWMPVLVGVALCVFTACFPYSGRGTPPMYGDMEAQRHWMEITFNLPVAQWYTHSEHNDLMYWGLDYPPLTAYHSMLCGYIASWLDPSSMALHESRGYEAASHILFMRLSVIVSHLLVYVPGAVWMAKAVSSSRSETEATLWVLMLQPAFVVIDHGHFQYNTISLGLALLSFAAALQSRFRFSALFFTLSMSFKHMSLYYAPALFAYIVSRLFRGGLWTGTREFVTLGAIVLGVLGVLFAPFLHHSADAAIQVLRRLFPVARGLYEDKVANVWCTLSPVLKLKEWPAPHVLKLCTGATLAAFTPACIGVALRPTTQTLLTSLAVSSLAFFLFSFQVHEKGVLVVLLPLTALFYDTQHRWLAMHLTAVAMFSMFPLLSKDGLHVPYILLTAVFLYAARRRSIPTRAQELTSAYSFACMIGMHALRAFVAPPERLPALFDLAITSFSCIHFSAAAVWLTLRTFLPECGEREKEKHA